MLPVHDLQLYPTFTVLPTHLQLKLSAVNTELGPHFIQSLRTCWYPLLQTHLFVRSTNCSTWLGPHTELSTQILPFSVRGRRHTQFPLLSSAKPFLHTQNPLKSSSFPTAQVLQSKSRGPSQVKHLGLHFWQAMFSAALSS